MLLLPRSASRLVQPTPLPAVVMEVEAMEADTEAAFMEAAFVEAVFMAAGTEVVAGAEAVVGVLARDCSAER